MKLEVVTPEDFMGDIIADLNRRRGQVESMDSRVGARVITAKVPLAEQFGYVTVLRTLSSGRASSSMEFDHYAEVPKNIAREVVEKRTCGFNLKINVGEVSGLSDRLNIINKKHEPKNQN